MTSCILAAADDVAADTREDSYDDATSRGGLLYRRAHNRVLADHLDAGCRPAHSVPPAVPRGLARDKRVKQLDYETVGRRLEDAGDP